MTNFTSHHSYPFPFWEVARGIWYKYPNEHSTHITSVDVIDRSFLPDGTQRTERLISIRQNAPRWITKLMGGQDQHHFFQRADIQAQNSLATGQPWAILGSKLESWARDRFASNAESGRLGFYSVLNSMKKQQADEKCSSSPSTDNPNN